MFKYFLSKIYTSLINEIWGFNQFLKYEPEEQGARMNIDASCYTSKEGVRERRKKGCRSAFQKKSVKITSV